MQMLTSPLIWKEKDTVRCVAKVLNVDYRSFENRFRKSEISKARNCLILRNKRRDATKSKEWEPIIIEFFRSEPVSRASPNMKDVFKNRKDGTTTPKRLLQTTLQRAYLLFKQEHPEYPFQYTVFRRSKPRDVVQTGEQHRSVYVCSKHANIQFKLTALQNALTANKIQKPAMLTSVEDLSNATLCPQGSVA
jgi:hypothetical protein